MAKYLRQSTASQEFVIGTLVDSTDGNTEELALSIANTDIKIWKHGATTLANKNSGGGTHIANGRYSGVFDATDTDTLGNFKVFVHVTGSLAWEDSYVVLPANVFDSLILGSDLLDVNTAQWLGTACAAPSVAGVPEVDPTHWLGTAIATPDTAGYPKVTVKSGAGTGEISTSGGNVSISSSSEDSIAGKVWDKATSSHGVSGSFGAAMRPTNHGTAQAGGANTITLATSAAATTNYYNKQLLRIIGGTGAGQSEYISSYTSGRVATMAASWAITPDNTSVYVVLGGGTIPGASAPTAADNAAAVWNALIASYSTEATFGAFFQAMQVNVGTAQAGSSLSITLDATGTSGTTDTYKYQLITIRAGTGAGQTRQIIAYNGTSKIATINLAWVVNPASDSDYVIHPSGLDAATIAALADAVWDEPRAGHTTTGTFGEHTNSDMVKVSGDPDAATNLEAAFDGTGYNFPNSSLASVATVTGNVVGSVGSVVGNVGGNVQGNVVGSVGSCLALAANSVTASALATDAVNEIQAGLATSAALTAEAANTTLIKAKTDQMAFPVAGQLAVNLLGVKSQSFNAAKPYTVPL